MRMRPIRDADWPRLQDYVRRHFGFSHIPDQRFHEHWFRNPFGEESWGGRLLERPDGSLAGALMVIQLPCWFAGRSTTAAYLSTGVVEADAREQGRGAALYLWAYRSFPIVIAMSGNAQSAPLNALLGREIPGVTMRRFLRLNRPECLALCRTEDRAGIVVPPASAPALPEGLSVCWVNDIPEGYDRLWQDVRRDIVCSLDRTAAYLRWRCAAPYVDYRILEIMRDDRLIGLAVCRPQETPSGHVVRVTEMITQPADGADAWRAVAGATSDALFTDFMVVGSGQDEALVKGGFLEADAANGLTTVPHLLSPIEHRQWSGSFSLGGALAQQETGWCQPDGVYFTKGDGDRDWPTLFDLERLGIAA